MQECHSASNHEIQPTNIVQLQLLWYTAAIILQPLISTKIPKHKGLSHKFQTVPTNNFNIFINTQSGLAPMMSGGSDGYCVTDATSSTVVTSITDTDNDVTT